MTERILRGDSRLPLTAAVAVSLGGATAALCSVTLAWCFEGVDLASRALSRGDSVWTAAPLCAGLVVALVAARHARAAALDVPALEMAVIPLAMVLSLALPPFVMAWTGRPLHPGCSACSMTAPTTLVGMAFVMGVWVTGAVAGLRVVLRELSLERAIGAAPVAWRQVGLWWAALGIPLALFAELWTPLGFSRVAGWGLLSLGLSTTLVATCAENALVGWLARVAAGHVEGWSIEPAPTALAANEALPAVLPFTPRDAVLYLHGEGARGPFRSQPQRVPVAVVPSKLDVS